MTNISATPVGSRSPLSVALLLACVGFITLLTEVLPAGVLPEMAADLGTSIPVMGQTVAVFAVGCIAAAIPLTRATVRLDRRTLLLLILAVSALANLGTALAQDLPTHFVSRFIAGLAAGLVWAMQPGYTRGFTRPDRFGATLGVVLSGATLAMALGVPVGTILATQLGWRAVFMLIAAITVALGILALWMAPRVPGVPSTGGASLMSALRMPAVLVVILATLLCVVGQNMGYTYLASSLALGGSPVPLSLVLAAFGVASVGGTLGAGRLADRRLGPVLISALAIGVIGLTAFGFTPAPWLLLLSAAAWGLAFGAYSVLFQIAVARAGGAAADAAQSALVTIWNISIALGGAAGGAVLAGWGPTPLIPIAAGLMLLALPLALVIARTDARRSVAA